MKKAILLILQFFFFLGIFLVGSFLHPLNLRWSETHITPTTIRYFIPDGLIIMLALYAVIVITQALSKRLRAGIITTAALLLALAVGLLAKFGSVTHDLY